MSQKNQRLMCPTCGRFVKTGKIQNIGKPKIVDESTMIPVTGKPRENYWDALLAEIPLGKAIVIPHKLMTVTSVSKMLSIRHRRGKFCNYKIVQNEKEKVTFIINHDPHKISRFPMVDEYDVPFDYSPKQKPSDWIKIFSSIPEGKALVVSQYDKNPQAMRYALKRLQKEGLFLHYHVTVRGENSYTIHHKKLEPLSIIQK